MQVTIQVFTVRLSHVITAYMSCTVPKINDTHALHWKHYTHIITILVNMLESYGFSSQ